MDIVVRTPHGDADVSISGHDATTTLGDVIGTVTGQATPRLALVDGHAVDCSRPLDEAGLLVGSVVTTEPARPVPASQDAVDLVQITGHGAGRVVRLGAGRYRLGPGRRPTAPELDLASVDRPMIELVIEPMPSTTRITVVPTGPDVALDGETIAGATEWQSGILSVGSRAFRVDRTSPPGATGQVGSASVRVPDPSSGTVAFDRPPRRRNPPRRFPVVDALHDAMTSSPWLWERRPNHADAFSLPFGLVCSGGSEEPISNVDIELAIETGVAIVGTERFRNALARTLLIEAVTQHGPADLDLVVLTSSERSGEWDWAKWLPHLRLDGPPAILTSEHDIERWMGRLELRSTAPHLTIVLLDETVHRRRQGSPLRPLLSRPLTDVKMIALCDDESHAPATCSAMISETEAGRARFHSFNREVDIEEICPSLPDTDIATRIARSLAPLVDVEVPPAPVDSPEALFHIGDLIAVEGAEDVRSRWRSASPRSTVTIGRRDHESVEVTATDDLTVVAGTSMNDAFIVAASFVIQQCVESAPEALWILPLIVTDGERSAVLWELPHATERHDVTTPIEPRRLLARVREVLADDDGPDRILVIIEDSRLSPASPDAELLDALVQGAHTTKGLGVLVVTDRWESDFNAMKESSGGTVIRVQRKYGAGRARIATVTSGNGPPGTSFTPPVPSSQEASRLEILPLIVGRPPTPLERRLELEQARSAGQPDTALRLAVDTLRQAARPTASIAAPRRVLVPPPLPVHVDVDELFRSNPGDGVPVGICDDPTTGDLRPRWWTPGQGSVLAVGSRRSGLEHVPTVIMLGLIDRFSPDDVRLVVIEPSMSRRRALGTIDNAPIVRAMDRTGDIVETLDEIDAAVHRAAGAEPPSRSELPRLVVVVQDLAWLRRHLADEALITRLDDVLTRAGHVDSGVDVIAYTGDVAGAGPFAGAVTQRLIGATSDHTDLHELGVEPSSDIEGVAGRCRWYPHGDLVQLALPDNDEAMLARRSPGGTA